MSLSILYEDWGHSPKLHETELAIVSKQWMNRMNDGWRSVAGFLR